MGLDTEVMKFVQERPVRHCVERFPEVKEHCTDISTGVKQIMPVISGVKKGPCG